MWENTVTVAINPEFSKRLIKVIKEQVIPGYKIGGLKTSIPVLQFTLEEEFIQEFLGCKEAALELGCIPENIRRACVGKSKTAMNFKWKYKNEQ